MRVIIIADDDSLVGKMDGEAADLLISLGDIWDSTIEKAKTEYGCKKVVAVKGNHDSGAPFANHITDLHLTVFEYEGIVFGGFGGSWKYKPRGHHLFEQWDVSTALQSFPRVDVFVAHNSPSGYHERDLEVHQGFEAFTAYIERTEPSYFIHGHQHVNRISKLNQTKIIGVFGEAAIDLDIG